MALRHVEGPERDYLSQPEVAEALRVSTRHLRNLIAQGRFPPGIRVGGKPVWPWLDVVAFLHLAARMPHAMSGAQDSDDD